MRPASPAGVELLYRMKNRLDSESRLKQLYGPDYFQAYTNDEKRDRWYRAEHDRLVGMKPDGGSIFDVGCGIGAFLGQFDDAKWQKFGVDISDFAAEKARARGISVKAYEEGYDGNLVKMKKKDWAKLGFNKSSVHTDIVSTTDRTVTAYLKSGKEKVIYKNGKFTI